MTESNKPPNILQRINAVMKEVKYVRKDISSGHGKGVAHDMVAAVLHGPLAEHGIVAIPNILSCETKDITTANGKTMYRTETMIAMVFLNIDDKDDHISVQAVGFGDDYGDKGPGKAMSYAVKTALLKTFMLETGEDDESRIKPPPELISQDQAADLAKQAKDLDVDMDEFWKYIKTVYSTDISSFAEVNTNLYPEIKASFQKKIEQKAKAPGKVTK